MRGDFHCRFVSAERHFGLDLLLSNKPQASFDMDATQSFHEVTTTGSELLRLNDCVLYVRQGREEHERRWEIRYLKQQINYSMAVSLGREIFAPDGYDPGEENHYLKYAMVSRFASFDHRLTFAVRNAKGDNNRGRA